MAEGALKGLIQKIEADLSTDTNEALFGKGSKGGGGLGEIYKEYLQSFSDDFGKFGVSVLDKYRSTVLPISSVNSIIKSTQGISSELKSDNPEAKSSIIEFQEHLLESYENTFLRIVGMPNETRLIGSGMLVIKGDSLEIDENFSFESIFEKRVLASIDREGKERSPEVLFLNQNMDAMAKFNDDLKSEIFIALRTTGAEKKRLASVKEGEETNSGVANEETLRSFFFETLSKKKNFKEVYNKIDSMELNKISFGTVFDPALNLIFKEIIMEGSVKRDLLNYHTFFFSDAALIFPPVQSSLVGYCISEPSKVISRPFDITGSYINSKKVKGSLLESVIRIRLDGITGKKDSYEFHGENSDMSEPSNSEIGNNVDSFSFIEKLIVNRIATAIENFGEVYYDLVENYFKVCERSRKTLKKISKLEDDRTLETHTNPNSGLSSEQEEEVKYLGQLKTLDNVILLLLNKGRSSDRSTGSFRTNNVEDGVSMDILLRSITIPSLYANDKIKKINATANSIASSKDGVADSAIKIAQIVGLTRGVGIIDLLCFSLAMFLVPTRDLLGLLDDRQYANFKKVRDGEEFDHEKNPVTALNNFSKKLFQSYELFVDSIE